MMTFAADPQPENQANPEQSATPSATNAEIGTAAVEHVCAVGERARRLPRGAETTSLGEMDGRRRAGAKRQQNRS